MTFRHLICILGAAAALGIAMPEIAGAQQRPPVAAPKVAVPSPAAVAMAKEVLELLGHMSVPETAMLGAIEGPRNIFIQGNPTLEKPLREVTIKLISEMRPRLEELRQIMARAYAEYYTEQELKELLTFFKTPTGKKFAASDTKIVHEQVYGRVDGWLGKLAQEVSEKIRAEMKRGGYNLL
jgi:hypothetical protein